MIKHPWKDVVEIKGKMMNNEKEVIDVENKVMLLKKVKEHLESSINEARKQEKVWKTS